MQMSAKVAAHTKAMRHWPAHDARTTKHSDSLWIVVTPISHQLDHVSKARTTLLPLTKATMSSHTAQSVANVRSRRQKDAVCWRTVRAQYE
jgi:hypothetical protein